MLVQMIPEQVSKEWEFYAPLIARSLPPMIATTLMGMASILRAILMEDLIVWNYYDDEDDLIFVMTTSVSQDNITMHRDLLIYSMSSVQHVRIKHFEDTFKTLKKYAIHFRCINIIAYTENEKIARYLKEHNDANVDFKLIMMEV